MQNRIKIECINQQDFDGIEPELKLRSASMSEKFHAWLCAFADMIPTLFLKGGLIVIAMAAIYFNGYASSQSDFERDIEQGWYTKNATKFEEAAQIRAEWKERGCTPWGTKCEENEVSK